ncbi:sodium-dependent noradrenaline transporter-like [Dermacentor albipictus]|uniref:sodium-dependent noradrenaline transporter-like n=1 Tax=Dermacentor albipictus TaxID=60249 RepID=UPI0038FC23E9
MQVKRQHFRDQSDCLLCCINFCIGLSNLADFANHIYGNGGLVFLAVYLILTCTVCVPMLYLELFLGQFSGWSIPRAFEGFPMARGLGWTMLSGDLLQVVFHVPAIAYSWIYLTASFSPVLPWSVCDEHDIGHNGCYQNQLGKHLCSKVDDRLARRYLLDNNTSDGAIAVRTATSRELVYVPASEYEAMHNSCINGNVSAARAFYEHRVTHIHSATGSTNQLDSGVALALVIVWTLIFIAIILGPRSLRKASFVMMVTRLSMLALLCIASCTLSGARQGMLSLLWPDLSKAYSTKTWISASQHMFYSVGLALGVTTFLASYNKFEWPVLGTAVKICMINMVYGIFAAFFVFAQYGHLAEVLDEDIAYIATSATRGLEYVFVTFPETIETLPYTRFWALAFYVLVATSALGPQLCAFGAVVGSLADLHPALCESTQVWAFVSCTAAFALSLPLSLRVCARTDTPPVACTKLGIGMEIRKFVTAIIYGDLLPWIGFAELIIVMYAYGSSRLVNDIYFMFNEDPPSLLLLCWRFVCPIFLVIIGLASLLARIQMSPDSTLYPDWAIMTEMGVFGVVVVLIGAFVLLTLAENNYDLYLAMEPQSGFGPKEPAVYERYLTFLARRNALPHKKSRHLSQQPQTDTALTMASSGRQGEQYAVDIAPSPSPCAPPEIEMRGKDSVTVWPSAHALDDPATRPSATEDEEQHSALPEAFATSTGADPSTAATFRDEKDSASSSNQEKPVKQLDR